MFGLLDKDADAEKAQQSEDLLEPSAPLSASVRGFVFVRHPSSSPTPSYLEMKSYHPSTYLALKGQPPLTSLTDPCQECASGS